MTGGAPGTPAVPVDERFREVEGRIREGSAFLRDVRAEVERVLVGQ